MGIDALKKLYKDDPNFGDIHKVFSTLSDAYNIKYSKYLCRMVSNSKEEIFSFQDDSWGKIWLERSIVVH